MDKIIFLFSVLFISYILPDKLPAQKQTFGIIAYIPPEDWKQQILKNSITYNITDIKKKLWCRIRIYESTVSKGNVKEDFEAKWNLLIPKPNNRQPVNPGTDIKESDGWKIKTGIGKFTIKETDPIALLTVYSGYNRCACILATTNSLDYISLVENLLNSVELIRPKK